MCAAVAAALDLRHMFKAEEAAQDHADDLQACDQFLTPTYAATFPTLPAI